MIDLEVGPVAHGGSCVARSGGRVVFVRHALPGERVRARVTDRSHDRYWRADAVEIIEPSPDRVEAPCPHAGPPRPAAPAEATRPGAPGGAQGERGRTPLGQGGCGGCDWQHASPAAQRRLKAEVVVEALRHQGGLAAHVAHDGGKGDERGVAMGTSGLAVTVEPVPAPGGEADDVAAGGPARQVGQGGRARQGDRAVAPPAGEGLGWRSRMRFAVTADGEVGLRMHRSHQVVATPDCRIAHPLVVDAVAGRRFPGAEAVEVAASVSSGRVAVRPTGGTSRDVGRAAHGGGLVERVLGREFRVDASAFWQIHPAAARTLVGAVLAALEPRPGERALDLYAGAGLFAAFLAEAVGPDGEVIAMESDAAAVASATRSLADLPWVSVRPVRVTAATVRHCVGGGARPADGPGGGGGGIDVAVLDPPRTGAGTDVLTALLALRPRAVAYVACDPVALGRDLAAAAAAGYQVDGVRAFDLFPMTAHIECVARLVPMP
ncbi:deoxyribonuclease [Pseudofrankia asymbiotica]|uniref:Deoxyribonuclease n=1 Tax=Pseudofrankia asymbiotica TaxID=1834516 RepID=A0A1V2IB68_9ACTN|nr:TRAM domain-containing protein [Pseudofrankia asymbiotica]ONH30452.1 deoxyribonuclease [Pseudofrankia asymbiotica]